MKRNNDDNDEEEVKENEINQVEWRREEGVHKEEEKSWYANV